MITRTLPLNVRPNISILGIDWAKYLAITSNRKICGMTNTASVKRINMLSVLPPKKPEKAPIETPISNSTNMAVRPIRIEI